jgi:hypothetical protein
MSPTGIAITRVVRVQSPMAYPATRSQLARLEVAAIAHGRYRHHPARFTTHRAGHSSERLFREREVWHGKSVVFIVPDHGDRVYVQEMTNLFLSVMGFKEIAVHQVSARGKWAVADTGPKYD